MHQFVHTKLCLYNRRVANDTLCPRCGAANEEVSNVLRYCVFSRNVWLALQYGCPSTDMGLGFKDLLSRMFDRYPVFKR